MSKRPKLGDIIEISLPNNGTGYAQYTHKNKQYGSLLRVFQISQKVGDIAELLSTKHQFTTFFPLSAALARGIVRVIGNLAIKDEYQDFPTFRAGFANKSGIVEVWWLWDGEKEVRVGELSAKQMEYPIRGVRNDTLLIERIGSGWQG
ncbi:hypothetical protein CWC22_022975 [Pseudoalteromonas rubra]|uniref:Uncharacterized protein n=1 Tax=Pseudoalteromonas rubra TaxID=43658 RepID=A0A5S3V3R3_9GAMM|nr:hypothetical protein [Pseudoalteromonas rubra]QPB85867.1 hypothetical protein CWC22_022975 [Pseudoalteromonas rubra]